MSSYYNEIDPFAARWLRNLIEAKLIAPGEVDDRSIEDVRPDDLRGFKQCHFFAGIGGWSYALRLAGWPDEREVWTGSCPCQPFSKAGKGMGFSDRRHLWPNWNRLIDIIRPPVIFGEQVAESSCLPWIDLVQDDLERKDYACAAFDICASSVGAPHARQRMFWVADSDHGGRFEKGKLALGAEMGEGESSNLSSKTSYAGSNSFWSDGKFIRCGDGSERPTQRGTCPLANGVSGDVERKFSYANAIVPQVAQKFIEAFMDAPHD